MPELNKPDTPVRRPWGRYAAVAAAVVLLALTPLAWFWFSDTALLGAPAAMTRPYTSLTATGDDFYLIRQLRAQREAIRTSYGFDFGRDGIENLYTGSAESMEDMTYSWGMAEYLTEMIEQLREAQVLDDTWADAAQRAVGYGKGAYTVYYSNDSLGFTRISVFRTDLYVPLLSVVVESKTSLPVTVWITSEDPLPEPDTLR